MGSRADLRLRVQSLDSGPKPPIDAVYLWVDGSDRAFQEALERMRANSLANRWGPSAAPKFFRDNGELRYSLRSLARFAPWLGHVYLVTNGQAPGWLDPGCPRVTVIPHEKLFPDPRHLPSFNSNAIEMHLHRIPGLSKQFLYWNDDLFLGRPVYPAIYQQADGRPRPLVERITVHDDPDAGAVHDRAYAYSQRVAGDGWNPPAIRHLPAHVPQLYDREIISDIERSMPDEFERTSSHRFRSPDDLVLRILHTRHVLASGGGEAFEPAILAENPREYCFVRLEASILDGLRRLLRVARCRPRFFCINDDVGEAAGARILLRMLPILLGALYPGRSPFEAGA